MLPQVDYPRGAHPLEPYATDLVRSLLRCISLSHDDAVDELNEHEKVNASPTALVPTSQASGATTPNQFMPSTRGRCAGLRGLCTLLTRAPSSILRETAIGQVLARFTVASLRDPEAQVITARMAN